MAIHEAGSSLQLQAPFLLSPPLFGTALGSYMGSHGVICLDTSGMNLLNIFLLKQTLLPAPKVMGVCHFVVLTQSLLSLKCMTESDYITLLLNTCQ